MQAQPPPVQAEQLGSGGSAGYGPNATYVGSCGEPTQIPVVVTAATGMTVPAGTVMATHAFKSTVPFGGV